MKTIFFAPTLLALWLFTFVIASFHAGTVPRPRFLDESTANASGVFIPKSEFGMNQLVLKGSAFARGKFAGELTQPLLYEQEKTLIDQLDRIVQNRWLLKTLIAFGINYFRGATEYLEPWALEEMYGVSLSAPKDFDDLADGFTRQVAYHALHEVGQLLVDQGADAMGCTVAAFPFRGSWVAGRNFDFEGGEIFDREKIVKWVFPDKGNSYVSVIWAGMVGAVTGVNQNGLYISMNAAGSQDYSRIGMPSTLVLTKALQFSNSAEEALEVFRRERMFITDIFVMVDAKSARAFKIEKSPERTIIIELKEPTIVANHLTSQEFASDPINLFRKTELTSDYRQQRGMELFETLKPMAATSPTDAQELALRIMRDKSERGGHPLHLHNRRAIDALIATHAVIYDAKEGTLFVGHGPGVSGAFTGFDLSRSFAEGRPVERSRLGGDPQVTVETVKRIRQSALAISRARSILRKHDCSAAESELIMVAPPYIDSSSYHHAAGDLALCRGDGEAAKKSWLRALDLKPAYASEIHALKEKLGR